MTAQVFGSILVGLVASAILFLPLLVWQYRRFGRFDGLRIIWTTAGFIYATAIVAFTVFPLPDFAPGYCDAHRTEPLLDPLRFPRELIELIQAKGPLGAASDWLVWEIALNMILFIPFGLIVRRVLEWPRPAALAAPLSTSILIELTQYTANWGLAPCPYRFADVTDLVTNSIGAIIGIGLEKTLPRLLSTKADLLDQKGLARPVTRGRRLLGMLLDTWYLALATIFGWTATLSMYFLVQSGSGQPLTPEQMLSMQRTMFFGGWLCSMATVVLPALIGNRASLGQRTVYLVPGPRHGARWRTLLRALIVQGAILTGFFLGIPTSLLAPLWAAAAIISVIVTPQGLSCVLTGCSMLDARRDGTETEVRA